MNHSTFETTQTRSTPKVMLSAAGFAMVSEYLAPPEFDAWQFGKVGDLALTAITDENGSIEDDALAVLERSEAWGLLHYGDQQRGRSMPVAWARDEDGWYFATEPTAIAR